MTVTVTPHLNFRGQARQALEHYQAVFGGHLVIATYADAGRADDPAEADLVLWGQVANDAGFRVMAFDVPAGRSWSPGEDPFYVSVRGTDATEVTACWERLAEGATVVEPLAPSAWSPLYGMVTDPFGITWVIDVEVLHAG
ncbi:VOC family protein [Nocardioides sp.]|uniref:VOC family protein n=1 Tax=Nocardioides sp. TaxID=35761 RepID=UPI00271A0B03|nr:VOC family protein [Nocardioides sp.]MDO9456855.1 VOC family protein [Nocardioides sp.]